MMPRTFAVLVHNAILEHKLTNVRGCMIEDGDLTLPRGSDFILVSEQTDAWDHLTRDLLNMGDDFEQTLIDVVAPSGHRWGMIVEIDFHALADTRRTVTAMLGEKGLGNWLRTREFLTFAKPEDAAIMRLRFPQHRHLVAKDARTS